MLTHFHFPSTSLSLISGPSHAHTHTHCRLSDQLADLYSLFRPQIPFTRGIWSPKAGGALLPVHTLASTRKAPFSHCLWGAMFLSPLHLHCTALEGREWVLFPFVFPVPSTVPGNSRCSKNKCCMNTWNSIFETLLSSKKKNVCCQFYRVNQNQCLSLKLLLLLLSRFSRVRLCATP